MNEFSTPISQDQKDFLATNKAELVTTEGGKAIWQNRIKMASEAYQIAKTIHADHVVDSLCDATGDSVEESTETTDTVVETFPDWPTYRDNFILDWISNRTIVTEEEANAMFNVEVENALQEIDQVEGSVVTPTVVVEATPVVIAKVKRAVAKKVVKVKAKTKAKTKVTKKVAAKKAGGKSASAKAQVIIEKFSTRGWTRGEIIQKLQDQLDMGAAYASTLYQKFA